MEAAIATARAAAARLPRAPRVYFEEWDEPPISGIQWVCELIRIAGGEDIFPERAACSLARDRILADPGEVVRRAPDLIIGSWCGKKFLPDRVGARPGWAAIPRSRAVPSPRSRARSFCSPGRRPSSTGCRCCRKLIAQAA
jgi:iron complex transport system substrate-binding protein